MSMHQGKKTKIIVPELGKDNKYVGAETHFQQTAMRYIWRRYDPYAYHVPNGGKRNLWEAARLKREGVKKGVPDIISDIPSNGYHGLRVELKVEGGRVYQHQYDYLRMMLQRGYYGAICWSIDSYIETLKYYFE